LYRAGLNGSTRQTAHSIVISLLPLLNAGDTHRDWVLEDPWTAGGQKNPVLTVITSLRVTSLKR